MNNCIRTNLFSAFDCIWLLERLPQVSAQREHTIVRPLFVGFMFFIRKFPGWYAGGRVITITHYTHFKFLLSKFSQIMAKIIIMNVGIDKTFLKFKFSQEIINNGEKCG